MIDYDKPYNNRDPKSLFKWTKNEDGTHESCNTFHLIEFFNKNERGKQRHCSDGFHFCECDFESVIKESSDPDLMRVFLTISNIVNETMFHLLNHHYKEFRTIFPLPRFESHDKRGEVGNINLIHERNHKDEQDRISYYQFNYEVFGILIDGIRFNGQTQTEKGFLCRIMDDCKECHTRRLLDSDITKSILSQSKMCVMSPMFYSVLRKEIKTNKVDIY